MTAQHWQTEFPDFTDMPALPATFVDTSWHNNACPSITSDELELHIWIDYVNPADREHSGTRFIVERQVAGIETGEQLLETDSWAEVLRLIDNKGKKLALTKIELGSVGKFGVRGIVQGYRCIAEVPLPPKGMTNTIEDRRAERDAIATFIVNACNAYAKDLDSVFVKAPATIPMTLKKDQ